MTTILLYGDLGKRFGKRHSFVIGSVSEAMKALKANFPGFERYMVEHSAPGYYVFSGKENLSVSELARKVTKTIKIVPIIEGAAEGQQSSGKSVLNIVLGILLIYFAPSSPTGYTLLGSVMAGYGISLILNGVMSLLFRAPEYKPLEAPDNKPSYAFNGAVNTIAQGNPVPVCYGKLRVGSQVISAGLFTEQLIEIGIPSKYGF